MPQEGYRWCQEIEFKLSLAVVTMEAAAIFITVANTPSTKTLVHTIITSDIHIIYNYIYICVQNKFILPIHQERNRKKKGRINMKCAMCGREIKGRDYIYVSTPDQKGIYVHSVPCEWYDFEGNTDDDTNML